MSNTTAVSNTATGPTGGACRFYGTPSGCRFGDRCKYRHDARVTNDRGSANTRDTRVRNDSQRRERKRSRSSSRDRSQRSDHSLSPRGPRSSGPRERPRERSRERPRERSRSPQYDRWSPDRRQDREDREDIRLKRRLAENLSHEEKVRLAGSERLAICYNPKNDIYEHDMDLMVRRCKRCDIGMGY